MTDRPRKVMRPLSSLLHPPLHLSIPSPSPFAPPLSHFSFHPSLRLSLPPATSPSPASLHPSLPQPFRLSIPAPLHPCIPASPPASPHLSLRLISLRELCLRMSNVLNRIIFLFQGKIIRSRTVGRSLKANVRSVDPVIPGERERRAALIGKRPERRKRKGSVSSIFPISWENRSMQSPSALQGGQERGAPFPSRSFLLRVALWVKSYRAVDEATTEGPRFGRGSSVEGLTRSRSRTSW